MNAPISPACAGMALKHHNTSAVIIGESTFATPQLSDLQHHRDTIALDSSHIKQPWLKTFYFHVYAGEVPSLIGLFEALYTHCHKIKSIDFDHEPWTDSRDSLDATTIRIPLSIFDTEDLQTQHVKLKNGSSPLSTACVPICKSYCYCLCIVHRLNAAGMTSRFTKPLFVPVCGQFPRFRENFIHVSSNSHPFHRGPLEQSLYGVLLITDFSILCKIWSSYAAWSCIHSWIWMIWICKHAMLLQHHQLHVYRKWF